MSQTQKALKYNFVDLTNFGQNRDLGGERVHSFLGKSVGFTKEQESLYSRRFPFSRSGGNNDFPTSGSAVFEISHGGTR